MRSFTTLLLALSLPLYALASHDLPRRHTGLARRARGDVLDRRDFAARLTYYDITVGITACGGTYPASAFVVALDSDMFGSGYPGPHCGKMIILTANGKTATCQIVDECPGCPYGGLDLTQGLFTFFADPSVGVVQGSWHFAGDNAQQPAPAPTPTPTPEQAPKPKPKPKPTTTSSPPPPPPPPTTTTTSSKKPPPTTTSSTPTTTSTTSTTSHRHSSHTHSTSSSSSSSSSSTPTPTGGSGLGLPAGVMPNDGQSPQNLDGLNNLVINYGGLVEACNSANT